MTYVSSITEEQIFTALRSWLIDAVGGQAVQGFTNRVSTPKGGFIAMSGLVKQTMSANRRAFVQPVNPSTVGEWRNEKSIDYNIQLDVYGPTSGNWASILAVAFASDRAWSFFNNLLPGLAPLYMEDARQSPIVTGEQQYDKRWSIVAHIQFNPSITDVQQSAVEVVAGIFDVEAIYPV
jgi:hypothetical protein